MAKISKFINEKERGFTLIELMMVVTLIAILASTSIAFYSNYTTRAKTTEAYIGLSKLSQSEIEYYVKNGVFLDAGPVNIPPSQNKVVANFSGDAGMSSLGFSFADGVYYGYQAVVVSTNTVDCEAIGDLNGNGVTSLFRQTVTGSGSSASRGGVLIFDEIE